MDSSAAVAQKIAAYNANPVTATSAYNAALSTYGIPEIRQNVAGLRTTVDNTTQALNNVDPSVTGRTSGSLVTEAQRSRMVNNERAPIAQELSGENNSLNTRSQDLRDALSQATTTANNQVNDYNTGRTALQNEYDTAYKREQDAAAAAANAAAEQERVREFNVSSNQSQQKINNSGSGSSNGPTQPTYQQRNGGAFNFQDKSGKTISARLYAQQTGTNFNTLLKQMAAAGDSGAADVLKHGGSSAAYKALTWD